MRPVNKGTAPKIYTHYRNARNDLASQIGWYCSYCEMPTNNMIEVEHIIPTNHGGRELEWENFLLSCKYCNTIKSNNNTSREGYLWPDTNNPMATILYMPFEIQPNFLLNLLPSTIQLTNATIQLTGIDRHPSSLNEPTQAGSRWIHRDEAWLTAARSYSNWKKVSNNEMLDAITNAALGIGFFSIWMTIFENELRVKEALINAFPGTALECFDEDYNSIVRVII